MMKTTAYRGFVYWMIGAIALLLFLYAAIRSSTVCLTIDEAFTFQRYVKNSDFFPQEYDMHTANFHMLNTWLMIVCSKIFGNAEWSLRLPGVLAYGLYLFFTAKLALKSKQTWSAVALFILLNVHPYMIDFFSVARGYALLLGFEAASLWYVCEYFTKGRQLRHLVLTLIFAGLGMWANFVGLMVFSAIALIVFVGIVFTKEITTRKKIGGVATLALIFIPFAAVAYYVIAQLQQVNAFFWGNDGFWDETVCVLGAKLAYPVDGNIYTIGHADSIVMLIVLLVPGIIVGYSAFRNRRSPEATELFILLALFGIVLLQAVVQHVVMQSPYPSGRTALFLFVIFLWILAVAFRDTMLPKRMAQVVSGIVVSGLLFLAIPSFNLSRTSEWSNCADVKTSLNEIIKKTDPGDNSFGGVAIGHDIEFGNILNYYLMLDHVDNVTLMLCSESEDPGVDYYIVSPYVQHKTGPVDTLFNYRPSQLLVLRNSMAPLMKTEPASETDNPEKIVLADVSEHAELFRNTRTGSDSVFVRVDIQAQLRFSKEHDQCIIGFWHWRNFEVLWCGYYVVEAWGDSLSDMHTVNRIFPMKAAPGDEISISIVPFDSVTGPIEVSDVRAHLRVSE